MTPRPCARPDGDDADARLDACLLRARPTALRGRAAEASAVRVLARVAALEGARSVARPASRPVPRPASGPRVRRTTRATAGLAAAVAGGVVVLVAGLRAGAREVGDRTAADRREAPSAAAALAVARSVAPPGPRVPVAPTAVEVRDRWLTIAEAHASDAGDALRALARLGGPCGPDEARRVAALHRDDALAAVVREVLAAAPGDAGPQALANVLVVAHTEAGEGAAGVASAEAGRERASRDAALVRALEGVARAGRATLALDGLRRAADAGCAAAAVGCLRVAGTPELDRALALVAAQPATQLEVVEAVTLRPRVLGAALLRRVERGDRGALALAAAARVEGLDAVVRPFLADPSRAVGAVDALRTVGDAGSVVTLALGLGGPADREARHALASLGAPAVATLEAAAAAAAGDGSADPYVAALAGLGDAALPSLVALADRPTLAVRVVRALAGSSATGASDALAALAARPPLTRVVVEALGARRAAGDAIAAAVLVEAGRAEAGRGVAGPAPLPSARPVAPSLEPTPAAPAPDASAASGPPSPVRPGVRPAAPPARGGGGLVLPPPAGPPVVLPPTAPLRPEGPAPRPPSSPAGPTAGGRSRSI